MAELKVFKDIEALSAAAARLVVTLAQDAVGTHGRFLVALSGGSTPEKLFTLLSQPPYAGQMPWQHTHIFWGDERLVPPDDPGSNVGQAARLLLNHVPVPTANIHRPKGELEPETAVHDYTAQLRRLAEPGRAWPRLDLAIMGLGGDGHTASLFPGLVPKAASAVPVIAVTADYDNRPAHRISLTPPVFNDARHVMFLLTGKEKAAALTAVLHGPSQPEKWPAQLIQPTNGQLIWLVDETAAGKRPTGRS